MPGALRSKRALGILAHIDAGKTSLTERLLFVAGRLRAAGSVDEGTTTTDFLPVERERGITVKAAAVGLSWRDRDIRIVDTPGHVDFGGEVVRSIRVLDSAVVLLCGVAGVQSRTEAIHRACESRGLPRLYFVNKLDRRGASFHRVYAELRASLDARAIAIQLPVGEGEAYSGLIDLLSLRFLPAEFEAVPGVASRWEDLSEELLDAAREARAALVEALAEGDEAMLAAFAEGREPPAEELRASLRRACLERRLMPVLCGSAYDGRAAAALLDAMVDYLPDAREAVTPEGWQVSPGGPRGEPAIPARRAPLPDEAFSAFIFKTSTDEHWGRLSWARIWSGRLRLRDQLLEMPSGKTVVVRALLSPDAAKMGEVAEAEVGDIVALALQAGSGQGKGARGGGAGGAGGAEGQAPGTLESVGASGASLCDPGQPIAYEAIAFADPMVSLALEPRARADLDRLREGVAFLVEQDPSLRSREDRDTGRILLEGLGELHLEVAVERLEREFGARVRPGRPVVSLKEALLRPARARIDFDRDENGERLKALVELELSPAARGSGLSFAVEPSIKLAPELLAALRRGLEAALSVGPAAGYPVEDLQARIRDYAGGGRAGSRKEARADERAAEIAAALAARDCLNQAGAILLEPWMRVELQVSEERLGEAMQSLTSREGRIEAIEDRGPEKLVTASAPLRTLFGFATELGSATAGRASYSARFSRYEAAPKGLRP